MYKNFLAVTVLIIFAFSINVFAQTNKTSLEGEGGIGIQVGGEASIGGHGFFYFSNEMSIGTHFGFVFDGGTDNEQATTSLLFAPYFNYYFTKLSNTLWLFGQACFQITSGTYSEYDPNSADYITTTRTGTALNINAGAEWRITKRSNIYGGFRFINFNLDPSRFVVGTGGPFIGFNWIIF